MSGEGDGYRKLNPLEVAHSLPRDMSDGDAMHAMVRAMEGSDPPAPVEWNDPNNADNPQFDCPDFDYEEYHWNRMAKFDRIRERACKTNWIIALVVTFSLFVALCHGPAHGATLNTSRPPQTCEEVQGWVKRLGARVAEWLARHKGATDEDVQRAKFCLINHK